MSKSLILSFNSAVAKYSRLSKKVKKSISEGEFWRYTRRKRHYLLSKIEKLKRRIAELRLQLKMAGAGLATALMVAASGEASAQASTLGPFSENRAENPFPRAAFDIVNMPAPIFADLDNDGDLDATLGNAVYFNQYMLFFQNRSKDLDVNIPVFEPWNKDGLYVPFFGTYTNPGRPAYADVDDDGDLDMVIGMGYSDNGPNDVEDDVVYFYRNVGNETDPQFVWENEDTHPFYNMHVRSQGWPAFTDYDKDGDMDFVLMGEYYDEAAGALARLQFYRNDNGVYTRLAGTNDNPLYVGPEAGNAFFAPAFADLDGDGDEDFFLTNNHGQIKYKRNDNGVFTELDGEYTFHPGGASTGNPLDIDNIVPVGIDQYKSLGFGDLDRDGDVDLVIGTHAVGTFNPRYIYVENTGNGVMVTDTGINTISGFSMGYNSNSAFIDLDGDADGNSDTDVVLNGEITVPGIEGSEDPRVVSALFKNNGGVYQQAGLQDNPFASLAQPQHGELRTIDIDGDSDLDALFITNEFSNVYYQYITSIDFIRNDNGTFTLVPEEQNPLKFINDQHHDGVGFDLADLNQDGLPDLAQFAGFTPPTVYKNTGSVGNAKFTNEPLWQNGLSNQVGSYNPKFIDLDHDGDNDMVIGKYLYFWYYENIGTSTVPEWAEYEQRYENQNLENPFGSIVSDYSGGLIQPGFGDIDGDGDVDLLYSSSSDGFFTYFENQNPAPAVSTDGSTSYNFVVGTPVDLQGIMTIDDQDGDKIIRITARITPYQAGREKVQMVGTHGKLEAQWDNVHGVLTISGNETLNIFQEALNSLQYVFTGTNSGRKSGKGRRGDDNGKQVQKTVTVNALDAELTVAPSNTVTFVISGDDGDEGSAPVIDVRPKTAAAKGNIALSIKHFITDLDDDVDENSIVVTSEQGANVIVANGIITIDYSAIPDFQGTDNITVYVCDLGGHCVTESFTVDVNSIPRIYTGMSPNGDETNDHFHIDYLPPGTKVAIYNRWGDIVYEQDSYNNEVPEQRFEGKNKNGAELTPGTYFYKIKFPDRSKAETGYILLNR